MKINRQIILVLLIVVAVFLIGAGIYSYIAFMQMKKGSEAALRTFDPTTEAGKVSIARRKEMQERINQENIAWQYYQIGEYERAIEEYKKALEMSEHHQWVSRYRLSEAYEKTGNHKVALQEIEWLISQNPRQQVMDELKKRKEKNLQMMTVQY